MKDWHVQLRLALTQAWLGASAAEKNHKAREQSASNMCASIYKKTCPLCFWNSRGTVASHPTVLLLQAVYGLNILLHLPTRIWMKSLLLSNSVTHFPSFLSLSLSLSPTLSLNKQNSPLSTWTYMLRRLFFFHWRAWLCLIIFIAWI